MCFTLAESKHKGKIKGKNRLKMMFAVRLGSPYRVPVGIEYILMKEYRMRQGIIKPSIDIRFRVVYTCNYNLEYQL